MYTDRLRSCKLPTLHYRRIRGDMIEIYKVVSGKYDSLAASVLHRPDSYVTRGHDLRLQIPLRYLQKASKRQIYFMVESVCNVDFTPVITSLSRLIFVRTSQ